MEHTSVAEVALAAVHVLDPDEVDGFALVVEGVRRRPAAARRAARRLDQPMAAGPGMGGQSVGTLALAVGIELAAEFGAAPASRVGWRPWRRRPGPDSTVVPLPEPDIAALRRRARELCLRKGAEETRALSLSEALAEAWPRLRSAA